ncbi:MAG TPA: GGDEF domain-containing protein [Alphaproteobacteria bacterium]|nr:GGDEF domain-containing protein [Alphaproteobacteria bacterium]
MTGLLRDWAEQAGEKRMAIKIEGSRPVAGPLGVTQVRTVGGVARAEPASAASTTKSVEDTILILGIPDAELTPRVRAAISKLMGEVIELKKELEKNKRRLDELEALADEDTLLPVLNRRAFVRELMRTKSLLERHGQKASLIYIDMNNFKEINDAYGHAAGDDALRHVGKVVKASVRSTDSVGRLGGDEFGVILTRATLDQAKTRAEAIAKTIVETPFEVNGKAIKLSIAYGVCEITASGDIEAELSSADRAMYEQKRAGNDKSADTKTVAVKPGK